MIVKKIALIAHSNTGIVALRRVKNLLINKLDDTKFVLFVPNFISDSYIKELIPEKNNLKIEKFGLGPKLKFLYILLKKNKNNNRKNLGISNEKYMKQLDIDEKDFIKFESKKAFSIKNIVIILIKLISRIIGSYFLNQNLKKYNFDIAIFSTDRTNINTNYLYSICRNRNIKTVLAEFAHLAPKEYYLSERSLRPSCYVDINGLFSRLFPDQIICKNSTTGISLWSITDTISMFITGVLPRDPLNIIGSLNPDTIICSSDLLYEKCLKSPFIDKILVKKAISVHTETVLENDSNKKQIRQKLIEDYGLEKDKTISIYSIVCLAHTNMYSEEESENLQLEIIKKMFENNSNSLIIFHPSITSNRYSKTRKKYFSKIIKEPLTEIAPGIDIYITMGETSAQEFLIPLNIQCLIVYETTRDLLGTYNKFENLHLIKNNTEDLKKKLNEFCDQNYKRDSYKLSNLNNSKYFSEIILNML